MRRTLVALVLFVTMQVGFAQGQNPQHPPLSEYLMTPESEEALARSAAPENVSAHATVKILTAPRDKMLAGGAKGFVRLVILRWAAPTAHPALSRDPVYVAEARA